jgi:hypothetical protein
MFHQHFGVLQKLCPSHRFLARNCFPFSTVDTYLWVAHAVQLAIDEDAQAVAQCFGLLLSAE